MKILHLDSGREMRGGQWQVLRLLRGLRKRGFDSVLLAREGGPLLQCASKERFPCESLTWEAVRSLSRQVSLVHAHDSRSHSLAAIASAQPVVVSRRVLFPIGRNPLSRWKYARPAMYAAVSEAVAAALRAAGVAPARIRVVHDGVPLLAEKWNPEGPVVFPHFNGDSKAKDLAAQAALLAGIPSLHPVNLEASLTGAGMLVYLSYSEGLGSAALLAMSAGLPVIASDIAGLREVVRHGETGFLVPNEPAAIASAVRDLHADPMLAARLSRLARQSIMERFTEDHMVDATIALYRSSLAQGAPS